MHCRKKKAKAFFIVKYLVFWGAVLLMRAGRFVPVQLCSGTIELLLMHKVAFGETKAREARTLTLAVPCFLEGTEHMLCPNL